MCRLQRLHVFQGPQRRVFHLAAPLLGRLGRSVLCPRRGGQHEGRKHSQVLQP